MGRHQNKMTEKKRSNKTRSIQKTRKQLRKEKRQEKKISKAAYYEKKRKSVRQSSNEMVEQSSNVEKDNDMIFKKKQKLQRTKEKKHKNIKKQKMEQLKRANLEEDKMIKRLEKRLKLNKRKSKSIPKSFVSDGLDDLLDFCESDNRSHMIETEKQLLGTGLSAEFKEDLDIAIGKDDSEDESKKRDKITCLDVSKDSTWEMENASFSSDEDLNEIDNKDTSENYSSDDSNNESLTESRCSKVSVELDNDKELWEDIYGRQRDKKGNIITERYVPPAARVSNTDISTTNEKTYRLERQFKGILNRLAEQNMHTIANQVEDMYMSNSRNDMNVTLSKLMMETIIMPVLMPDRLISEHMMLIAILHANVGTEVGAHFLLTLVKRFHHTLNEAHSIENKELDNIILMISHLYNFKVYGHRLLYQILEKLSAKFSEKEIELILLILRTVGFLLRKDDPAELKKLILNLQQKANNTSQENSRIKFMLEVLLAIKNNNMSKIPQYDASRIEHLRKIVKNFIHKGNNVTQFNVTLEDLLKADERGKWWIIGSAWSGLKDIGILQETSENEKQKYSEEILELARKQRMNTSIRKDIFCVVMTAEDYLDAFEKIHHLGLKNQQQREVIYVILSCCIQEKKFNPYYAVLTQRLCDSDRKYQLTVQYALWDKFKALDSYNAKQLTNLAKFLTLLFLRKGLPLSILKVIEFTELDKSTMRLVRQIMLGILLYENEEMCLEVFERISSVGKLQTFRESLRLFINHFLVRNMSSAEKLREQSALLEKRAESIDKILSIRESNIIF